MKDTFTHFSVYSMGDPAFAHWTELLKLLHEGYEIVSAASDQHAIHYILKDPRKDT